MSGTLVKSGQVKRTSEAGGDLSTIIENGEDSERQMVETKAL